LKNNLRYLNYALIQEKLTNSINELNQVLINLKMMMKKLKYEKKKTKIMINVNKEK
jgi:hypothetical protein